MHDILRRLTEFWTQKLQQELSPFCDPGTELKIISDKSSIQCELTYRGEKKDLNLKVREDGIILLVKGQEIKYRDFLAGVGLADLRGLAKMIAQTSKDDIYIPAKITTEEDGELILGFDNKFIERIRASSQEYTQLLMVTGEAGSGKTSALKNLVKVGAERFLRGESDYLFLYINAQGRALSRFNEALSTELNELRSIIPYHGISTLVKNGVLIPIVDGFDELLGISGSEDAFSSLSSFIEELDGSGTVLASSRSSYFENEFRIKANQKSSLGAQSWILRHCKILHWSDEEVQSYLDAFCASLFSTKEDKAYFTKSLEDAFSSHPDLKHKPLFLTKIAEIISEGADVSPTDDLLSEIVTIQLKRECYDKLLSKTKTPILKPGELLALYTEIAEEMWNQETRELNKETVSFIAEYILSEYKISNEHKEYIVARLPNAALLLPGEIKGSLTYEHEAFFDYFISDRLAHILVVDEPVIHAQSVYGRSHLSMELSRRIKDRIKSEHSKQFIHILSSLNHIASIENSRTPIVRENFGRIIGVYFSGETVDCNDQEVRNIIFPEIDFLDCRINRILFSNCEFRSVNFSAASITKSRSSNSLFFEPVLNFDKTILEISGVIWEEEVIGIKSSTNEDPQYDPVDIYNALVKISMLKPVAPSTSNLKRQVSEKRIKLLERFFNLYKKRNPISKGDEFLDGIFKNSDWNGLEKILIKNRIITTENRDMSGPQREFLRRQVLPEDFLKGINKNTMVPPNIENAWKEIEALN